MAKIDGELVGHLSIVRRTVLAGSMLVEVGGIGGVTTHELSRRRGVAAALLDRAARFMRDELGVLSVCSSAAPRSRTYTPAADGRLSQRTLISSSHREPSRIQGSRWRSRFRETSGRPATSTCKDCRGSYSAAVSTEGSGNASG
ncbi:MAG: GNAT family N-acetyltransferase [Chloroflexi bacterium]|nr:GNAT family N-acetyltransferase [Chloroflexota bacterium]